MSAKEAARIREARPEDAIVLSEIIRRSFRDVADRFNLTQENCPKHPSNCTDQWIRSDLHRGVRYFVLEDDGIPSGCVALELANDEACYLERLCVVPEKRRQGFGKALVRHVLDEATCAGARHVSIGIISDHAELKEWYRKIGFTEGETKGFPHLPFHVTFMSYGLKRNCQQGE